MCGSVTFSNNSHRFGAMPGPGHVPVLPPTTVGRCWAWLPSEEGLEAEARPSSRPSSEKSAEATRSATRRSGRQARDIVPLARTGSLTSAGAGAMALKHTQETPVSRPATSLSLQHAQVAWLIATQACHGRPAGVIEPLARAGALTPAGTEVMALKHSQSGHL